MTVKSEPGRGFQDCMDEEHIRVRMKLRNSTKLTVRMNVIHTFNL